MVTLTRAGWGARPPKARTELNPARVTTLFLHHTTGTYTDWKAATKSIQAFHMTTRGWNDIAYNWLVAPDGTKIEGRGWMAVGGHTKGHNSTSVAIAYLGDGRQPVSDDAKRSIIELADTADAIFGKGLSRRCHSDVGATECPGALLRAWWNTNPVITKEQVQEFKPGWVSDSDWQRLRDWVKRSK
jgi:hypothetical protein